MLCYDGHNAAAIQERFNPAIPVYRPPPAYPGGSARGSVVMGSIIEVDGTISHASVVHSSRRRPLDAAALAALQSWGYDPARLDGEYVRSFMCNQISFNFVYEG